MPRPQRIEYENAFYHITNRCRERKAIFHGEAYYQAFLTTLAEAADRFRSGLDVRPQLREKLASHLIISTVASCCRVSESSILFSQGKGGSVNIPRKLAMYYCQRFSGMSLKAITHYFRSKSSWWCIERNSLYQEAVRHRRVL